MADITITAANVVPQTGTQLIQGDLAGETIVQGTPCYRDASTGKWMRSDANGATAASRRVEGIALVGCSLNQPIVLAAPPGTLAVGAVLTQATIYVLSDTVGRIMPSTDLGAGEYTAVIGVATSTSLLKLGFINAEVAP